MLREQLDIAGDGKEFTATQTIMQNNMSVLEFAKMLRAIPPEKRSGFKKQCRIRAIIPFYLPKGMFQENETALDLAKDKDKMGYMLREAPEFRAVDDPLEKGGKLVITGK